MHLTSNPVDWYAARAAGIAAYLMLTVVVGIGITMGGKLTLRRWPRFAVEDVHRFGGLLVGTFIVLHVVTVAIDSYVPFSLAELAIPMHSHYRPLPLALGIVAAELLLALAVTNHYRRRVPYRFWRTAHYLNFAVWGSATVHGVLLGTDRSAPWMVALYAACCGAIAAALAWRIAVARGRGWTVGSGVAACLLAAAAVSTVALGPGATHARAWDAARFTDRLTGRILVQQGDTAQIVSMAGNGSGSQPVLVRADLLCASGGCTRTSLKVEYLPSGDTCVGTVSSVRSRGFDGSCVATNGGRRAIHAQWRLVNQSSLRGVVVSTSG